MPRDTCIQQMAQCKILKSKGRSLPAKSNDERGISPNGDRPMRTRITFITALVLTILAAEHDGRAQLPNESGNHVYANEVCPWDRYNTDYEMRYRGLTGRILTQPLAEPDKRFTWQSMEPSPKIGQPPMIDKAGNSRSLELAANALCGALIEKHVSTTGPSGLGRL